MQILDQIKCTINSYFGSVKLRVIIKTDALFPPDLKESLSTLQKVLLFMNFYPNVMWAK